MIHPLYDDLPDIVIVQNAKYPVVVDFHNWISFLDMLQDESYTPKERVICAMSWYLTRPPHDIVAAYESLIRFASCTDMPRTGKSRNARQAKESVISYRYDGAYIIGDFLRFYQIDLTTNHMHWYKFQMLLDALPDDASVKQRAAYRSIDLAKIKDKTQREHIRKVKSSVRIPREKNMSAGQIGAAFG